MGAPVLAQTAHWLARYFAGTQGLRALAPDRAFRQAVWAALMEIPMDEYWTCGRWLTLAADRKKAAPRAVGARWDCNHILMIPATGWWRRGALTGYAGAWSAKKALLALGSPTPRSADLAPRRRSQGPDEVFAIAGNGLFQSMQK